MPQQHSDLLDKVLDKNSHLIPEDLRIILHAMRNEHAETYLIRKLSEMRLQQVEKLMSDHITECKDNKEKMDKLLEVSEAIQGSVKMGKWLQSFVLYVISTATAIYGFYKLWKG